MLTKMDHLNCRIMLLLMFMVSACSPQEVPTPTPTIKPSAVVVRITATLAPTFTFTATATPTLTATPMATYTPYPTQTAYPTYTPLPTPTISPIAVVPPTSVDWPITIRRTAETLKGNPVELNKILVELGAIGPAGGEVQALDLTHNGQNELLVWYLDPNNQEPNTRGNVLVLTNNDQVWRLIFDAVFSMGGNGGARLLEARDLNKDGQNELAYALTTCGTNICSTNVRVGKWDGTTFHNLTVSDIRLPSLNTAIFNDSDGDGVFDMVLTGGALQSVRAGPQRERSDIYQWTADGYTLKNTLPAATDSLPLTVWDANDAMEAGDLSKATKLYERVGSDESLRPWVENSTDPDLIQAEVVLLRAFSRFRLVVAYLSLDNQPAAEQSLEILRTSYTDSPFRQASDLFIERWLKSKSLKSACRVVNDYAEQNISTMVDPLNDFGYTGPQFLPQTICPLN